jgi:prolyl-tRNA editing enzyme YbaK/EbsC (Cys-tRNA(Pro) deacylase)
MGMRREAGSTMTEIEAPASVQRVQAALIAAGSRSRVIELKESARSAAEAATALGVLAGAIVKSLVFLIGGTPVMALLSGDRRCREDALPAALGMSGVVARADAVAVRAATGFAIGGVAPVGLVRSLPVVIDVGLGRFPIVYAAAGHPFWVFPTTMSDLVELTGARINEDISASANAAC